MEIFYCSPSTIKIKEGFERFRKDIGDVKPLAESIQRTRQIMPVIVTRDMYLIDGGRRLAACMMLNKEVKCVFEDVVDDAEMRELEIEANCHRKDFTPAEKAFAIKEFHRLRQIRYGKSHIGTSGGHTLTDTANDLNMSKGAVIREMQIAAIVEMFPDLASAKKPGDILKAAKGMQRITEAIIGARAHEEAAKKNETTYKLILEDANTYLPSIPDSSIQILLTDPLYGIDADKNTIQIGGETGGSLTTSGFKIEDRKEDAFFLYKLLARESGRFCTDDAHGYIFVGPEHFHTVSNFFREHNWQVHIRPLIWIKRESGQNNSPHAWPSSCYEMVLYMRRENSKLVRQGQPDWFECPPVSSANKTHVYEKPVAVLENLLSRVSLPGQIMLDPFMGSGSSIEAAVKMKLFATGVDISQEAYLLAQSRMANLKTTNE